MWCRRRCLVLLVVVVAAVTALTYEEFNAKFENWADDIKKITEKYKKCNEIVDKQLYLTGTWSKGEGEGWEFDDFQKMVAIAELEISLYGNMSSSIEEALNTNAIIIINLASQAEDLDVDFESGGCADIYEVDHIYRREWAVFSNNVTAIKPMAFGFLVTRGSWK